MFRAELVLLLLVVPSSLNTDSFQQPVLQYGNQSNATTSINMVEVNKLVLSSVKTVDAMMDGRDICLDEECKSKPCWGYESGCGLDRRLFLPHCDGPPKPWASTIQGKQELFWKQGDFGYVKDVKDSLMTICKPVEQGGSSLVCSTNTRYCRAKDLLLDLKRFKEFANRDGDRYTSFREDIFQEGEVGGHCELDKGLLKQNGEHKSALQSWYAELEEYTGLDFNPFTTGYCDEIVTVPTIFIKLDAGINLYHHYCDFFNLYASQHVNGSFSKDINIVTWDTSYRNYRDFFSETWQAFTDRPLMKLADFANKRVPHCTSSALMAAFSKHLINRLAINQTDSQPDTVRITLLSRRTKHRRITNEDELVLAMKTLRNTDVRVVDYSWKDYPFLKQIESSHNSDVFIGMHGAGLTHLLFLPDWAAIFEIYNTEDPKCYLDLARLRGVEYQTWEDSNKIYKEAEGLHPQLGTPHAKFTNYSFDIGEFMRIMTKLTEDTRERKRQLIFNQ